jgi:hypothetical protein
MEAVALAASVKPLMEVGAIRKPPPLIVINGGANKTLTEAVTV